MTDKVNVDVSPKLNRDIANTITPPLSPRTIKDASTRITGDGDKWLWWQGYRKDRRVLGFEAPSGKSVQLAPTKRGPRKKKKDDD
jgi:hypothetical protein